MAQHTILTMQVIRLAKWLVGLVLDLTTGIRILRQPLGALEKPSPLGSSHGYQRFMDVGTHRQNTQTIDRSVRTQK